MDWIGLFSRVLHILASITIVGGTFYLRFVFVPATKDLTQDEIAGQLARMRPRWSPLVAASAALLLVSGFYNFFVAIQSYELPKHYHPMFGVKFLLALFIFFVASALAGADRVGGETPRSAFLLAHFERRRLSSLDPSSPPS